MSTSLNVHEYIQKEIRPKADVLLKAHDKQTEKVRATLFSLKADIDKKNERMIRLHAKALEAMVAELAEHLSRTARLLHDLEALKPDQSLVKDLAEVEKLTEALGDLERKLTKNYGIVKSSLDEANDALEADEAVVDTGEATREWAVMEAWLRKHLEIFKKRLDQIGPVRENARKAVAARNAKALAEAIKSSSALATAKPTLGDIRETYSDFCTKCDAQVLTKNLQDQLARDRKTFDAIIDEMAEISGKVVAIDKEIAAMELEPVDVKKAAALLKIPGSQEAKLKKALSLDGPAMEKALDALAKELRLKTTGREMIAALKKAKLS